MAGCNQYGAQNYNPLANVNDGSCQFLVGGYDCENQVWVNDIVSDSMDTPEGYVELPDECPQVSGCNNINATNYDDNPAITQTTGCQYPGCADNTATNYGPYGTVPSSVTMLWGPGFHDGDNSGCEYPPQIQGCTDPNALNYNPEATIGC